MESISIISNMNKLQCVGYLRATTWEPEGLLCPAVRQLMIKAD
jgi:hypothetical protein